MVGGLRGTRWEAGEKRVYVHEDKEGDPKTYLLML